MGFADYFLIVWDFIGFAKRNGVSVGPGRGSAAGSLAAYCLEITDIDPMRYGLLFERFLNPARKDMPDMDIDFAVEGRERVINYVAEKYGRDRVAQIITFSKMAARAGAPRRRPRARDPLRRRRPDREARSRKAPARRSRSASSPAQELRRRSTTDPVAKEIVDLARPLEGLDPRRLDPRRRRRDRRRAADRHRPAASRRAPTQEVVTQFSMNDVEELGLLKMDFLGLRNLDVIDKAVDARSAAASTSATIPLDDRKTYEMLAARRLDRRLPVRVVGHARGAPAGEADRVRGPDRARRALPAGPDAVHPRRTPRGKNGREPVAFIDPRLAADHRHDYGICIYQEQSMEIAKQIAGFSPAEADDLRKAIGKKIHELMASLKDKFLDGLRRERRHRRRSPSSSGRTWRRRRTTPSTRRTPPATR